jgi:hypothetical protein
MKSCSCFIISFIAILLASCGMTTYSFISSGIDQANNTRFNIKHVRDGCCGCSGILVNTFENNKLQSQLFIESNEACPFNRTKYYFNYSPNGNMSSVDTLIAVSDNSFRYPVTNTDKIALTKVDSFIAVQNSSYRLRKIEITGYREKSEADKGKVYAPRLNKEAVY